MVDDDSAGKLSDKKERKQEELWPVLPAFIPGMSQKHRESLTR